MRAARASDNARLQQAPLGPRHADVGSKQPVALEAPPVILPAPRLAPTEATRRWAALLQQIFAIDPLACPTGHGAMRIVPLSPKRR
jgi:hypothetical protein